MIAHGTAGKYKSATFRTRNNGDGLNLVCDNTIETFTIPNRNVDDSNAFVKDNYEDYMWHQYILCEFLRALFAICSGVSTNSSNGTITTVEILNSSGQQAAVNEDMYFWIGGTNTGIKAKYNLNSDANPNKNSSTGILTQSVADYIYDAQKANGINMNDTGVNSSTKHVLLPGMKGAEAIAVDGYWYIKTPFITNPYSSSGAQRNQADAPVYYFCKNKGVSLMSEKMLLPYSLNRNTHVTAIVNLLRTTEGLSAEVPVPYSSEVFSPIYYYSNIVYYVNVGNSIVARITSPGIRYGAITCPSTTFKDN
jgi:hypothetical protein